ncbi:MAG: Cytochrome-c peroxidase [Flavisolibacter sp.]|nr:Cytochrome-c peroxidase [Flavisolibacter sp.]
MTIDEEEKTMKRFTNKVKLMLLLCSFVGLGILLTSGKPKTTIAQQVILYYTACLDSLQNNVAQFETEAAQASPQRIKELFVRARYSYKKIEWLVEYSFPSTAQKLNGPALPEAEPSEPAEPQHPSGFQVLEELVYDEGADSLRKEMLFELSTISNRIQRLKALLPEIEVTETTILDALKLNLYRIITKGISGFDSPIAMNSINEVEPSLQSTKRVLSFFNEPGQLTTLVDDALLFIKKNNTDFNSFNRAVFISRYMNPLCTAIAAYQLQLHFPFVKEARAVAVRSKTLFDIDAFDPVFYAPSGTVAATEQQVRFGKMLFSEPLLSSNGKRSCSSCHNPKKAFTDGLVLNKTVLEGGTLLRNTPTLLNVALQPVQFYDSRIAFLEDQAHDVISSRQEMGGLFENIVAALNKKKEYRQLLAPAYNNKKITADGVRTALAAYVRSLVAMNSSFDRYMRGENTAMNSEQVSGFNIFMGKAKCGTCHFMPTFSGTVPPLFDKMESEVLGVPATKDTVNAVQDLDSGKYHLYKIPHHLYSFKTPSLRNSALTAPYMHNGVFTTLEEVLLFYNRGGGAGLGFTLPNQTLPPNKLNLTVIEQKQVIAFLEALTDTATHGRQSKMDGLQFP